MKQITISDSFKKMTIKAIGAIVLFIVSYITLAIVGMLFAIGCGFVGFKLMSYRFTTFIFLLSMGIITMGILVFIFLTKFIFKKNITTRAHLIEISATQEPLLFDFIQKIVDEVNTDFPKKIYLSSEVNASVFYDSSFLSMFFPIKKNLQIGMGLINSVTVSELEAILAHEFGHFSQKSMKVGSYVYNVNRIIYNLLYENASFDAFTDKIAALNTTFGLFVAIAKGIISGIQWLLRKIYEVVNLNYMSLSREMEFNADEIAAHVAGSRPLITSLLRLELAEQSYNEVLVYYSNRIATLRPSNIYPQQLFVLNFLGQKNALPSENQLPLIDLSYVNQHYKTRLVIVNQWESHPSTESRVKALLTLNITTKNVNSNKATSLFANIESTQKTLTNILYTNITEQEERQDEKIESFIDNYTTEFNANKFDTIFNGYYDNKNPIIRLTEINESKTPVSSFSFETLFGNQMVELIGLSLTNLHDIQQLQQIHNGVIAIQTFDFDGIKYSQSDALTLIEKLELEQISFNKQIEENDNKIYLFFLSLAQAKGQEETYFHYYHCFEVFDKAFDIHFEMYGKMRGATLFLHENLNVESIEQHIANLKQLEPQYQEHLRSILADNSFATTLSEASNECFLQYLSDDLVYFSKEYNVTSINLLLSSLEEYYHTFNTGFFRAKKELLDFQIALYKGL